MAAFSDANVPAMAKLVTQGTAAGNATFQGYPHWHDRRIKLTLGDTMTTISREEIAALAALFPCAPKK